MREVLQQFARSIYSAPDVGASVELMSQTAAELGFAGASCVFWPGASQTDGELPPPAVQLSGSNLGFGASNWQTNYIKRGLFKADFVYRAARRCAVPVVWSYDALPEIVLGHQRASLREIKGIAQLVEQTGLRGGISIPVHGPGGFFGYVAFTSRRKLPGILELQEACGDNLIGMAVRFYDAVADKLPVNTLHGRRLTVRELECLTLLAMGKTLEEAGEILNLSYSTVRFHLHNAEHRLGVRSRAHAIAKAASLGLLGRID